MVYLTGGISIKSDKSLGAVAEIISQCLLGGVRFVGEDESIYDEVPAVYAEHSVLGLTLILQGHGGEEGYFLELYPEKFPADAATKGATTTVDITEYLVFLLDGVGGISVSGR